VRRCDTWTETTPVNTLGELGRTVGLRRRSLRLTQQNLAFVTGVAPSAVSRLEQGRDDTTEFRVVLLIVNALGLDVELRPRGSKFTPRPPTKINELGLSTEALAALSTAGIRAVSQLGTASDLVQLPEFSSGVGLFEIVCALNRYGLSLKHGHVPDDRNREIFRLRIVEGLTLKALGERFGLNPERVRQILAVYFGLAGTPPATRRGRT
jgi:transcriptional regulator with XRE-family HTH domain